MGFRRLLSSIGIGAATVDTRLEKNEFVPGEEVRGVVEVKGGGTDQEIEGINLIVQAPYERESGDHKVTEYGEVGRFGVAGKMNLGDGTHENIPFAFRLPYETPLSMGRSRVAVRTALDVRMALDPSDEDPIDVRPNRTQGAILAALESLGFRLREAETVQLPHHLRGKSGLPFGQELEFVARSGEFRGRLDELEIVMFAYEGGVDVMLQVDRRARGLGSLLSEAAGMDESRASVTVTESDAAGGTRHVSEMLAATIRRHA